MKHSSSLVGALILGCLVAVGAAGCSVSVKAGGEINTAKKVAPAPVPAADGDADSVLDRDDKCPKEKEDGLAPAAKDGCPNLDPDGDNIVGANDQCPDKAETANHFLDEDGCPDMLPLVELKATMVQINDTIQFDNNSADIKPESNKLLDAVASVLKDNAEVEVVEVGGHASKKGEPLYNVGLTQNRVNSVVAALVTRGVPKERLVAQGFGFYCPTKDTAAEADANRRVEFKILQRAGKPLDVTRGCKEAVEAGVKLKPLPQPVAATGAPVKAKIVAVKATAAPSVPTTAEVMKAEPAKKPEVAAPPKSIQKPIK